VTAERIRRIPATGDIVQSFFYLRVNPNRLTLFCAGYYGE